MLVKAPATLYKTPVRRPRKDGSGDFLIQSIIIEGSEFEFFGDVNHDVTRSLNGDREKLDSGVGVDVTATLELESRRGRPTVNLVGIEPRPAAKP